MRKAERGSAHARAKDGDLFQLGQSVFANHGFDDERQFGATTARERAHEPHERTFAAPAIVSFPRCAVLAESDVSDGVAARRDRRPHAFEMPAIRHEAALQSLLMDGCKYL